MNLDIEHVARVLDWPAPEWAHQCHAVSCAIVRAGLVEDGRVARGACLGVPGQHSWVTVGNPYNPSVVIDATLWSYVDEEPNIVVSAMPEKRWRPHGAGSIWRMGKPNCGDGELIPLDQRGLHEEVVSFLDVLGPLDMAGWCQAFCAVEGWPSAHVLRALIDQYPQAEVRIPIDVRDMLLDGTCRVLE